MSTLSHAPIEHLLVPVDPAGCAHEVVLHAARLAAGLGARLHLLHVVELPPGVDPTAHLGSGEEVGGRLDRDARAALAELAALAGTAEPPGMLLMHGQPVEAILRAIPEVGADLVVMGTHGRTGLRRLLVGSVAEELIRQAPVPVMVVRAGAGTHEGHSAAWERVADEADG